MWKELMRELLCDFWCKKWKTWISQRRKARWQENARGRKNR